MEGKQGSGVGQSLDLRGVNSMTLGGSTDVSEVCQHRTQGLLWEFTLPGGLWGLSLCSQGASLPTGEEETNIFCGKT